MLERSPPLLLSQLKQRKKQIANALPGLTDFATSCKFRYRTARVQRCWAAGAGRAERENVRRNIATCERFSITTPDQDMGIKIPEGVRYGVMMSGRATFGKRARREAAQLDSRNQ